MSSEEPQHTIVDPDFLAKLEASIGGAAVLDPDATMRSDTIVQRDRSDSPWTEKRRSGGGSTPLRASASGSTSGFEVVFTEHIGSGGVANVDAATQTSLEREVAIKRPKGDITAEIVTSSLIQEARLMGQLEHPNIPPIHELAYDDKGNPMILMKRIRGETWSTVLNDSEHAYWSSQAQDALHVNLRILIQVCHALEYAHSKDIIHRDIKPGNVMLGEYGEVYLLDWGFAVVLDEGGQYWIDAFYGTPSFAAPEMFSIHEPLTVLTDVYLLGATLHKIITGRRLHIGSTFSDMVVSSRLSPPFAYPAEVHPDLAAIANRATHKEPARRYESVSALRAALEEHLNHFHVMDLLRSAKESRGRLESLLQTGSSDLFAFYQGAFQGQFACQKVLELRPEHAEAQKILSEFLLLLLRHEIQQSHLRTSKKVMEQIRSGPHDVEALAALEEQYKNMETSRQLSGELSTQIQYKLMEKLQDQSND